VETLETVVIPANNPVQNPVAMDFFIRHPYSVWDLTSQIEYEIRDFRQFQSHFAFYNFPVDQPNVLSPVIPGTNTDYAGYIVSFFNRGIYCYPIPSSNLTLTINYIPVLPALSSADPYWTNWYSSSAQFALNYAAFTPFREFYPYTDAIVQYAIIQHCMGFDSKWADKMVARAEEKLERHIENMLRNRTQPTHKLQASYNGGGLEYYNPNGQFGQYRTGRII